MVSGSKKETSFLSSLLFIFFSLTIDISYPKCCLMLLLLLLLLR